MTTKLALAIVITVFMLTSCGKGPEPISPSAITKDNVAGTYHFVSVTDRNAAGTEKDATNEFWDPCVKDNTIILKGDNTYTHIDTGEKCSPATDFIGTWSLPDVHTLVIDSDAFPLVSFDGKVLRFSVVRDNNNGEEVVSTLTYSK